MLIKTLTILVVVLMMRPLAAFQTSKPESHKKAALTEEEKEILKNREILENLDLLQNLDKFRFFDFFATESEPDKSKESKKPASEKDEKKAK